MHRRMDKQSLIRKCVQWIVLIVLVFVWTFSGRNTVQATELLDYSGDLLAYCRSIAKMNADVIETSAKHTRKSLEAVVLCKTDGGLLDYAPTNPVKVIRGPEDRYVLTYSSWEKADDAIQWFKLQNKVKYAEHDSKVTASEANVPNQYKSSFLSKGAELLHMEEYLALAREYGNGSRIVAIIDSGVCTHSMLKDRMISCGFDYVDNDADPTNDLSGHGTHIAGIVADCTGGTQTWLYPVRVLDKSGNGVMSNVVSAVLEAINAGADVINLSLESFEKSDALDDAILSAKMNNITVVIAAGNHSCNTANVCPAHIAEEGIIVVGAAEKTETDIIRAEYSNFGNSVDLYAFGSDIISCSRSGGYVAQSGTSMAAAHISGLCSLIGLLFPEITPQAIENRLISICDRYEIKIPDVSEFVPTTENFYLNNVVMSRGDTLQLPTHAEPETSYAGISWLSMNEGIAYVDDSGCLSALAEGSTYLKTSCMGFEDSTINLTVLDEACIVSTLPQYLHHVQNEAFYNSGVKHILIPDSIESIGDKAFANCSLLQTISLPASIMEIGQDALANSKQAIILCDTGSVAFSYAAQNELQYIAH